MKPETVLERAVALADAEGLTAVTVRRLAQELGVTPMALYWHFQNKDHLLDALAAQVIAEIDLGVDRTTPWLAQLETLLHSVLRVFRAHPWAATLFIHRANRSDSYLRALDVMLDILRQGGLSPAYAVNVARHALRTVTMLITDEPGGADEQAQRSERAFLESLPPDLFPRVIEAADPLAVCGDLDAYYAFGLELLLSGIAEVARQ
jgi:TetR/AcrR family transcriptional regulator, tetracycline repressor protein